MRVDLVIYNCVNNIIWFISMFSRFLRPLFRNFLTPQKVITASTLLAYTYFKTQKMMLDSIVVEETSKEPLSEGETTTINLDEYIQKLQTVDVCEGKDLIEGERKVVNVKDHEGRDRKIMVIRLDGKLYSFNAACPHKEPF